MLLLLFLLLPVVLSIPVQPYYISTLTTPLQINSYDSFGTSVSIRNNSIAVGADVGGFSSQGVVHTFKRDGNEWHHDQQFIANDGKSGDRYGNSVVVFDEFLFVGAFLQDRSGKVYVYRNNEPFVELVPQVRVVDGYFGHVVKAKNYTLAVGHPSARVDMTHESGNVVVYNNWGLNWVISNYVTPNVSEPRALHGFSLDFDRGDEMVVGAPKESGNGRGYIYKYDGQNGNGRWNVIHSVSGVNGAELGHAVSISGNHSAMSSINGGTTGNGYVVTLRKDDNGEWVVGQTLTGDVTTGTTPGSAYYGKSMVMDDMVLAVGSPFEGTTGAVYVYHWWDMINEWRFHHKLVGPSPDNNDWYHSMFGWSVDMDKGTLLVGSPGAKTTGGAERAGSVFVFKNFYFEPPPAPAPAPAPPPAPPPAPQPSTTSIFEASYMTMYLVVIFAIQ